MSYHRRTADRGSMDFVPFTIASRICVIDNLILRSRRKDARDHGRYDEFLREADESFVEEVIAAYGVSRLPVPLMVSLGAGLYLPCYAVLVGKANNNSSCWDTYHGGLITIKQRVAERMGVATTLPNLYMEVDEFDLPEGLGEDDMGWSLSGWMRETEVASALPSRGGPVTLPPISDDYGTYTVASARGSSVYLQ
jgi:hypothetical protein